MRCGKCGRGLTFNELGLNRKFNANDSRSLCKECLAEKLGVTVARLDEKIEEFLGSGCKLFVRA